MRYGKNVSVAMKKIYGKPGTVLNVVKYFSPQNKKIMQKIPIIELSTDYEKFKFINGNRSLNYKKIEKIERDIISGFNLLAYCPVIVFEKDETKFIVDGQHRFTVSKELQHPVYYTVTEEINLYQIATMNSKQDKWTHTDFLKCYVGLENENYKILDEVVRQFKISIGFACDLLMHGKIGSKKAGDVFREGNFKVNFHQQTVDLLELSHSLFERYKFFSDRNLITAVQLIKEKGLCDFNFLKEKISQAPMMMDRQVSPKEYIYNIERVYNHKAINRKVIY